MLNTDMRQIQEALVSGASRETPMQWASPGMRALYAPAAFSGRIELPELFRGLSVPFSNEVYFEGKTYLVAIDPVEAGTFYMARDITLFEDEITALERVVWSTSLLVLLVALVLARIGGLRLVRPIRDLASRIEKTRPGETIERVPTEFHDSALNSIAETFNVFLHELEVYIARERTLLRLASHELRTPIAVVAGALNVMRDRGALGEADLRTLTRAQRAAQEMAGNLDVVLKLGRGRELSAKEERFSVCELLAEVLADLASLDSGATRISLTERDAGVVSSDKTLAKMLLLNVLQNALRHTDGAVNVVVSAGWLEVHDQGTGLDEGGMELLVGEGDDDLWDRRRSPGLGLVVVRILAERLAWPIRASRGRTRGMAIRIEFLDSVRPNVGAADQPNATGF